MELHDFAAVAEIIGVITIVITFLFLGVQVRESSRATRASVFQSMATAEIDYTAQLILHADIWEKVLAEQKIVDPVERRRAMQLFSLVMIGLENRFMQHTLGYVSAEELSSRETATKLLVDKSIYNDWCQTAGYLTRSGLFREYLETLRD